jgi:hypothetical protein
MLWATPGGLLRAALLWATPGGLLRAALLWATPGGLLRAACCGRHCCTGTLLTINGSCFNCDITRCSEHKHLNINTLVTSSQSAL